MSNVGARKDMPRGDFGAFEGEQVLAGSLQFQGSRPADRILHEGDTVHLLVQAEVRAVSFSRNADGDLVRRHVMRVVEAAEAPEHLFAEVVEVVREAADEREERVALPLDTGDEAEAAAEVAQDA